VSLSPTDLRQRIEEGITAVLGSAAVPWAVSRYNYDTFPGPDAKQILDLSFAVGLPSTEFAEADRQRRDVRQAQATTTVGVKFTSQLRADNQVADTDTALEREAALIAVLRTIAGQHGPHVRFDTVARSTVGDGTVHLADLRLTVVHAYPIG
jgi:hypothetical protein